jgi:hypothetical protein
MNDMSATIVAKSDQINAGDVKGISRTITIKEVRIKAGEDQPVSILIEGDAKAFRPCKGVRRLLVRVWGPDASKYIGQSMTIFCDPTVTWAGKEEGGIRVSHMTGLDEKIIEYIRTSRAATKPYTIQPLRVEQPRQAPARQSAEEWAAEHIAAVQDAPDVAALDAVIAKGIKPMGKLAADKPELHTQVSDAYAARRGQLAGEGRDTPDMGEGFVDGEDWEQ